VTACDAESRLAVERRPSGDRRAALHHRQPELPL
jgi:hypothetical protein